MTFSDNAVESDASSSTSGEDIHRNLDASDRAELNRDVTRRFKFDSLLGKNRRPSAVVGKAISVAIVAFLIVIIVLHQNQLDGTILGLGSGALIAGLALSIVVTYRGSGVVNFASGAVAMFSGYVFWGLRTSGRFLIIPLPNPFAPIQGIAHKLGYKSFRLPHWPTFVSLGGHWGVVPAFVVTLAMAMVVGLLMHLFIFRRIRYAPALAKVVVAIGLLITLQAIIVLRYTSTTQSFPTFLPSAAIRFPDGITVPTNEIIVLGIVLALAVALFAVYRWTTFGLRTRAAAENEKGAILRGYSPDALAGINWAIATGLAALIGILASSLDQSLDPNTLTLLVVPAIAAAMLGKFSSVSLTVTAGLGIGAVEAWIQALQTENWFPKINYQAFPGFEQLVPLLVIAGVLWFRARSLPTRGNLESTRLPRAPKPKHVYPIAAVGLIVGTVCLLTLAPAWRLSITNSIVGAVMCLSLVVVTGYVGQISLAQMALAGAAAFLLSKLAEAYHIGFPWAPLIAIAGALITGLLVSVPALRIRGVNLAAVTLAAGVAVENLVFFNPWFQSTSGASAVPSPQMFGLRFGPVDPSTFAAIGYHGDGLQPDPWFGFFCLLVLVAVGLAVAAIRQSRLGRRMLAVRANERAAAGMGINVTAVKLSAFAIASIIAGIGGVLAAYSLGSATDAYFGGTASLLILAFAYLGGISTISGAMVGGLLAAGGIGFTISSEWLGVPLLYSTLVGGVGLVITAMLNPEGVAGANLQMYHSVKAMYHRRRVSKSEVVPVD
jgi:branched-chain amino acid transport system permease protein